MHVYMPSPMQSYGAVLLRAHRSLSVVVLRCCLPHLLSRISPMHALCAPQSYDPSLLRFSIMSICDAFFFPPHLLTFFACFLSIFSLLNVSVSSRSNGPTYLSPRWLSLRAVYLSRTAEACPATPSFTTPCDELAFQSLFGPSLLVVSQCYLLL